MYAHHRNVVTDTPMMLSDMAFWNPSEIIGTNPRPLDYSLYRAIITRRAWNQGIAAIGFRKLDQDLMHQIGNKPYICLEYSFYSLIPQKVDEPLALRLVKYYQEALKRNLTAHDKIEFEIVFSTYDFGTEERIGCLLDYGFTEEERRCLTESLKEVTEYAILHFDEILEEDLDALKSLEEIRENEEARLANQEISVHQITGVGSESHDGSAALWNASVCPPGQNGFYGQSILKKSYGMRTCLGTGDELVSR